MEPTKSSLRYLLFVVLALVAMAILSNFYVASQLSRNSDELASIRLLIQKQMMGAVMTQSEELQKRMDSLNQTAGGIDAKMKQAQDEMEAKLKKAQDDLVVRMQDELPKIMDNYVKTHTPALERQAQQELQKRGVPLH
jgi:HAMP domain-containing protein